MKSGRFVVLAVAAAFFIGRMVFSLGGDGAPVDVDVGECFNSEALTESYLTGTDAAVNDLDLIECNDPHMYEVYAIGVLADTPSYPTADQLDAEWERVCEPAFGTFTGMTFEDLVVATERRPGETAAEWEARVATMSIYASGSLYPDREGWTDGNRRIECHVFPIGFETTTGSARGSMAALSTG